MGAGGIWWHSHPLQPLGLAPRVSAHAQVAEAKGKADEARLRAQAALDKANQTRARVESSNKELRELISHVKAFLSRECQHARGLATTPAQGFVALHLHHTALTLHCAALHMGCATPAPCCIAWSLPCPNHPLPSSHLWPPCSVPCFPLPFGLPAPSTPVCCREHTNCFHLQRRGLILRALRW